MENTQLAGLEDDVFSSRDATNRRASPSRIHFPPSDPISARPIRHRPEGQKTLSGLTPPVRRGSPLNPQNSQVTDSRRRPWPSDMALPSSDSSSRHRRNLSLGLGNMARIPDSMPGDLNRVQDGELEVGAFSNEYDLAHEDPRILQDVQRALKLKARREARMKRDSIVAPEKSNVYHASPASPLSETHSKIPLLPNSSPSPSFSPSPNPKLSNSTVSDVDFSPSTGFFEFPTQSHPTPSSLDNGTTLDWTGTLSDDDKRWTISIGKRKGKDKLPPLGVMMDQQETLYKEKLSRINSLASPQTIRKTNITNEQLGRRYNLIYASLERKSALNLASIARWYSSQDDAVKKSLEKAEPFTWLKHLEKRSPKTSRSPWNLSALVMEECAHAQEHENHMQTIPEDSTLPNSGIPVVYPRKSHSPSFLSSTRLATDDRISFEPFAESNRNSSDATSRKSAESALSTFRSGSSHGVPLSPISTRIPENTKDPRVIISDHPPSPSSSSRESSDDEFSTAPKQQIATSSSVISDVSIHPPSSKSPVTNPPNIIPLSVTTSAGSSGSSQPKSLEPSANQSLTSLKASLKPRRVRVSLPHTKPSNRRSKKYRHDREEQLRREYETKASLLAETVHHNNRIRQLLNRISNDMKDYDSAQNIAMQNLGINLVNVPKDLVEAFGHDPSGVTGTTRRLRGWQAVEDIDQRVFRQRRTFAAFLDYFTEDTRDQGCLLDEPIEATLQTLEALRKQKADIAADAEILASLLKSVQEIHGDVKQQYNATVAQASIVYPQLSHIVALEESYKDQYQHFWELGMDALTLLLDTVTPFWRTYGKRIGEDVRDFLIVPLYRNEFTGEARSYRIKKFPTRSLRHWFGFVLFFLASIGVNILQVRAAILSTLNCRLLMIPYDGVRWVALPFFWVGIIIQWLAVIFEFAIVFMQLGAITWWTGWSVKLLS